MVEDQKLLRATKGIVKAFSDGTIKIEDLDEQLFARYYIQMAKKTQT